MAWTDGSNAQAGFEIIKRGYPNRVKPSEKGETGCKTLIPVTRPLGPEGLNFEDKLNAALRSAGLPAETLRKKGSDFYVAPTSMEDLRILEDKMKSLGIDPFG